MGHELVQSISSRMTVRPVLTGACNAVRIPTSDGSNIFVGRALRNPEIPQPIDYSILSVFNKLGIKTGEFTPPLPPDVSNLEDARGILNGKLLGEPESEVALGLTAVVGDNKDMKWHLALTSASLDATGNLIPTSELLIIRDFKGKNATPIEWDPITRDITFLGRRDDDNKSHELLLCKANLETKKVVQLNTIQIPSLPWNESGIGTVGAPIIIDGHKILFIHGRREKINGDKKNTIYSLGAVEIDDDWNVLGITNKPIIERFHLPVGELRPDDGRKEVKEVVYSTDNATEVVEPNGKKYIELAVSYGDMHTAMVKIPVENIFNEMQLLLPDGHKYVGVPFTRRGIETPSNALNEDTPLFDLVSPTSVT